MSLDCEFVRAETEAVVGVIELKAVNPTTRHWCGYWSQFTHVLYVAELEKRVPE
jgi:hypothetical protein